MSRSDGFFKKGFYNHHQPHGLPTVRQFIVTEVSGQRCLLLRFSNDTSLKINEMKFSLIQLDASGKVINKSNVKCDSITFLPQSTYSHSAGIAIKNECADFKVEILYVVSGKYKYVNRNNCTVATYDSRGYNTKPISGNQAHNAVVKRKRVGGAFMVFAALISAVLLALSCYLILNNGWNDFFEEDVLSSDCSDVIAEGMDTDL